MKSAFAILLASTMLVGVASAQYASPPAALPPSDNAARTTAVAPVGSDADAEFYHDALAGGEREILLSRIAKSQSASADVKNLASTLIDDHTAMNRELMDAGKLAEPAPSAVDRKAAADLSKMSGPLFDTVYLETMQRDHMVAIALFEQNSVSAHGKAARDLATTSLPKLRQHLLTVEGLQKNSPGS